MLLIVVIMSIGAVVSYEFTPIDFAPLQGGASEDQWDEVARQLDKSFNETGFALVKNHGVPLGLLSRLRRQVKDFFAQPAPYKIKFDRGMGYGYGGYIGYKGEQTGLQFGLLSLPDQVESLTVRGLRHLGTGKPPFEKFMHDMADVPAADPAPEELEGIFREFFNETQRLRDTFAAVVTRALKLPPGRMENRSDSKAVGIRLPNYLPLDRDPKPNEFGYGEHSDSGGLAWVAQDPENPKGTEVKIGDTFHPVYISDGIVVNVGMTLSHWTDGRWPASIHRVVRHKGPGRLSLVSGALTPRAGSILQCFKPPCKLPAIPVDDYYQQRVKMARPEFRKEIDPHMIEI